LKKVAKPGRNVCRGSTPERGGSAKKENENQTKTIGKIGWQKTREKKKKKKRVLERRKKGFRRLAFSMGGEKGEPDRRATGEFPKHDCSGSSDIERKKMSGKKSPG